MKLNYPTYKMKQRLTPDDELWCCDGCGNCFWAQYNPMGKSFTHCSMCTGKKGGFLRMRRATEKEKQEARKVLKDII